MKSLAPAALAALMLSACEPASETPQPQTGPEPGVAAPAAMDYDAVGTEPFWAAKVRGKSITLSRPETADVVATAPEPEAMGDTLVYWGTPFNLTILRRACSDGMSDRKYAYEAEIRIGDEVLKGCADKAPISATPAS